MRPSVRPSSVSHVRFWVMSYTLHLVHCLSPAKGLANTQEHQTPSNRDRCQILLRDHVRKQHNRSEDNGRSSPTKDLCTSCDKVAQRQCRQMDVCVCCDFLVCVCVCLVSVVSVVSVCLRACVCVSACQTLAKQRLFLAQTDGIGDLSTLVAAQMPILAMIFLETHASSSACNACKRSRRMLARFRRPFPTAF